VIAEDSCGSVDAIASYCANDISVGGDHATVILGGRTVAMTINVEGSVTNTEVTR
jgi:hypothetical protein